MESKNFVHEELKQFVKRFAASCVRYEYDPHALVHMVEVLPGKVYHTDKEYIAWENDIYNRFVNKFPCENICFTTEDSLVSVEKPDMELFGDGFLYTSKERPRVFYKPTIVQNISNTSANVTFSKRVGATFTKTTELQKLPEGFVKAA